MSKSRGFLALGVHRIVPAAPAAMSIITLANGICILHNETHVDMHWIYVDLLKVDGVPVNVSPLLMVRMSVR